jgi:hypothetical protein
MKNLAVLFVIATAASAHAQPGPEQANECCTQTTTQVAQAPIAPLAPTEQTDGGWHRPPGERFVHGVRIGWTYVMNFEERNRPGDNEGDPMQSVKEKYGLKTPNMMLIGYEGMYRVIGHSWLNVIMVGNVTVAGLEQSKFIPAASGLIGAEFNESFQLGVGVNVTPDPDAPTHAIFAAGWTPRVGSIYTPVHFFFVPEPSTTDAMGKEHKGNHRIGATVGVTW